MPLWMHLTTYSINNKDWNNIDPNDTLFADLLTTYSINNKDWNKTPTSSAGTSPSLTTYSINNKDWNILWLLHGENVRLLNDLFH